MYYMFIGLLRSPWWLGYLPLFRTFNPLKIFDLGAGRGGGLALYTAVFLNRQDLRFLFLC